jgi:hypothetical protein
MQWATAIIGMPGLDKLATKDGGTFAMEHVNQLRRNAMWPLCLIATALLSSFASLTLAQQPERIPKSYVSGQAGQIGAYIAAANMHLATDPIEATSFVVFSAMLEANTVEFGGVDKIPAFRLAEIGSSVRKTRESLREYYGDRAPSFSEAMVTAIDGIAAWGGGALAGPLGGIGAASFTHMLAAQLQDFVALQSQIAGRYRYAGAITTTPDLQGIAGKTFYWCTQTAQCVELHDSIFAKPMMGVSISASFEDRIQRDPWFSVKFDVVRLSQNVKDVEERVAKRAADANAQGELKTESLFEEYWSSAVNRISAVRDKPEARFSSAEAQDIDAYMTIARGLAFVMGNDKLVASVSILHQPVMQFVRLGPDASNLVTTAATMNLFVACIQVIDLLGTKHGPGAEQMIFEEIQSLKKMIVEVHGTLVAGFAGTRADLVLAANTIDTRVAGIGIAIDGIRDQVLEIRADQLAGIRSDFEKEAGARWAKFESDNERCFGERYLTAKGVLRADVFKQCEETFLHSATIAAKYETRSKAYSGSASQLRMSSIQFPFHDHYPLLLVASNTLSEEEAYALMNPLEWYQNSSALLRLYRANPSTSGSRIASLNSLLQSGKRLRLALRGLVTERVQENESFRSEMNLKLLADYFKSLEALAKAVIAADAADKDPYGKRLSEGLQQQVPLGQKYEAVETLLSKAKGGHPYLKKCRNVAEDMFTPQNVSESIEIKERFPANPNPIAEVSRVWASGLNDMGVAPRSWSNLVPRELLWASLIGFGDLDICLSEFRPTRVRFGAENFGGFAFGATTRVKATLQVHFFPSQAFLDVLRKDAAVEEALKDRESIIVAEYSASRSCEFRYSPLAHKPPCPGRANCLRQAGLIIWNGAIDADVFGGRCDEGDPALADELPKNNLLTNNEITKALSEKIAELYWPSRSDDLRNLRLDVLTKSEFQLATESYLQYLALASLQFNAPTDGGDTLRTLFAKLVPAPLLLVDQIIAQKRPIDSIASELAADFTNAKAMVAEKGKSLVAHQLVNELPQIRNVDEMLAHIEIQLSVERVAAK